METINNQEVIRTKKVRENIRTETFQVLLEEYGLTCRLPDNYYILAGPDISPDDRVIYISVIQSQLRELLEILLPQLVAQNLAFGVVKDISVAEWVLSGMLGYDHTGKVMMMYVPANCDFGMIIQKLIDLTGGFKGPIVPGLIFLGGLLYVNPDQQEGNRNNIQVRPKKQQTFQQKYIVLSSLKDDVKGNVSKGIYFKGFLQLGRCVIKEGNKYMVSDDAGRDMKDRLEWQRKIHQDLSGLINVPKIIDLFEENGNTYLVMEFIKGKTLEQTINQIYNGKSWQQLSIKEKNKLLNLLLEVVEIVEKIHVKGYIHRDLTHVNFLITSKGKIYIIDWELAYGINLEYPLPVFQLGTSGFMSPEQSMGEKPTVKEDIYALGALMIIFFTNMPSVKFDLYHTDIIKKAILFFTGDLQIAEIVSKCLSNSSADRPSLQEIIRALASSIAFQNRINGNTILFGETCLPHQFEIRHLINSAFEGLIISELTDHGGLFNIKGLFDFRTGNRLNSRLGLGLMSPITGILFLIYKVKSVNFPVHVIDFFKDYLEKYKSLFLSEQNQHEPGLFYGLAGKAITLHFGVQINLLPNNEETIGNINNCFFNISDSLDLANGVAGQLLAALSIYKDKPSDFLKGMLIVYAKVLLDSQIKDGSWPVNPILKGKQKLPKGLENGVSGIVLSLIKYDELLPDDQTRITIEKGLRWLKKSIEKERLLFRKPENMIEDQSLVFGSTGVALVFLYAFEYLKKVEFKDFAESILLRITEYKVSVDYSVATGISGAGLVYAEAARICDNQEWKKRAAWIYNLLATTYHKKGVNQIIWNIGALSEFDAGILTGTSGIILFLIKLQGIN